MLNSAGLCVTADEGETVQNVRRGILRRKLVILCIIYCLLEGEEQNTGSAGWPSGNSPTLDIHKEQLSFLCSPLPFLSSVPGSPSPRHKQWSLTLCLCSQGSNFSGIYPSHLVLFLSLLCHLLHSTENLLCPKNWDEH